LGRLSCFIKSKKDFYHSSALLVEVRGQHGRNPVILASAHGFGYPNTGEKFLACKFYYQGNQAWRYDVTLSQMGDFLESGDRSQDWAVAILTKLRDEPYGARSMHIAEVAINSGMVRSKKCGVAGLDFENATIVSDFKTCQVYVPRPGDITDDPRLLLHSGDTANGMSGGILFGLSGGKRMPIGLHIGFKNAHSELEGLDDVQSINQFDRTQNANLAIRFNSKIISAIRHASNQ
jgi:hypothetical protein